MKKTINRSCEKFLIALFLVACSSWPQKITLAVNDLLPRNISESDAQLISERIRSELVKSGHYQVMERSQMDEILKEQGFQASGACSDDACLVEMGQLLGVRYMVSGVIGKMGDLYTSTLKLIDVSTGQIVSTISQDKKSSIEEVMTVFTPEIAGRLDKNIMQLFTASVEIKSSPEGAAVFLNGEKAGKTNLLVEYLQPGKYALRLDLKKYRTAEDTLLLEKGAKLKKSYTLELVDPNEKPPRGKSSSRPQTIRKIVFGVSTAALLGTGLYFNSRANDAYDAYTTYTGGDPETHEENWKKCKDNRMIRNIFYIASGLSAAGFTVSFFF